ncbi:alpha/beta fold hydrolase [Actinokineospora sp.]|uniref:alpha/beta fold hydrolase n=1 Tax=Actinokineospora sp. TaxID=1872133 RepID=UPI003D6A34A0
MHRGLLSGCDGPAEPRRGPPGRRDPPGIRGHSAAGGSQPGPLRPARRGADRRTGLRRGGGHSFGANVALEMAVSAGFTGPLVLLAPSLSRGDASMALRVLNQLGKVAGHLPFVAALKALAPALKREVSPERHAALAAEILKNDPRVNRRQVRAYLAHLDGHGAGPLCASGVPAWLVFGEKDDVGLTDGERSALEACDRTKVVMVPGAGHMTLTSHPTVVAEVLLEALASTN